MQAKDILVATREAAGLTQRQAAPRAHVSFSSLEKWERGAPISPPMLAGVLLLLGASAADALKGAKKAAKK